jgi:hypothetical protein
MSLSWAPKCNDILIIKHYKIPLNFTIRTVSMSIPHSPNGHPRLSRINPNPLTLPNAADLITESILAPSLELCEVMPQIQRDTILRTFPVYPTQFTLPQSSKYYKSNKHIVMQKGFLREKEQYVKSTQVL